MLYIDHKYVGLLSSRLERFTRKNAKTYICRCPICGDSQKSKYKTRGYLYEKQDKVLFYCHNCHVSMQLGNFIKHLDQILYKEYIQEKFIERTKETPVSQVDITKIHTPLYRIESPLAALKKISQLRWDHPAKKYVDKRKIPPKTHYKLFYCPKFKEWVNGIIPEKFDSENDEPRLIIPFLDKEEKMYGFQGRSFRKDGLRYITIMVNPDVPKVFGLDTVDLSKHVYVTEGPIDSLFLENSLAMAGSDLDLTKVLGDNKNVTVCYDNEPRNKEIVKKVEYMIDKGYNVVIWPPSVQSKDINDMVLEGIDVKRVIAENSFKGLEAKLKLTTWRK